MYTVFPETKGKYILDCPEFEDNWGGPCCSEVNIMNTKWEDRDWSLNSLPICLFEGLPILWVILALTPHATHISGNLSNRQIGQTSVSVLLVFVSCVFGHCCRELLNFTRQFFKLEFAGNIKIDDREVRHKMGISCTVLKRMNELPAWTWWKLLFVYLVHFYFPFPCISNFLSLLFESWRKHLKIMFHWIFLLMSGNFIYESK